MQNLKIFFYFTLPFFVLTSLPQASATTMCARQLMDTVLEITEEDAIRVEKDLEAFGVEAERSLNPTLEGHVNLHPIEALETYSKWMQMKDTRPDLVVAGAIKLLDAVERSFIQKEDAVEVIAKNFENLVSSLPHGDDYEYVLSALPQLFDSYLKGSAYVDATSAFMRIHTKKWSPYKTKLLERIESSLLAIGYRNEYYKQLGEVASPEALKWNQLRLELKNKVADRGERFSDLERYMEGATFSLQFSAYLKMLSERQSLTDFYEVMNSDPVEISSLPSMIQYHVFSLARVPKPKEVLPQDFPTILALKNIKRAFDAALRAEDNLNEEGLIQVFESSFTDPSLGRQVSKSYLEGVGYGYHSYIQLAFVWEKVILMNLESDYAFKASEEVLLREAVQVPEFIFRFVYQHTESSRMRSFLARLERLRES